MPTSTVSNFAAPALPAWRNIKKPKGLYYLGTGQEQAGTGLKPFDAEHMNFPWLSGYAWRRIWGSAHRTGIGLDLGISAPSYQLTQLDTACTAATNLNKDFSLLVRLQEVPKYVLDSAAETYVTVLPNVPGGTTLTPSPWDVPANAHLTNFITAVANRVVSGSTTFASHPRLSGIRWDVMGRNHLCRNDGRDLTSIPGYTRKKYVDACLASLGLIISRFPNKTIWFGLFAGDNGDGGTNPPLWKAIVDAVASTFGPSQFRVFLELWNSVQPRDTMLQGLRYAESKGIFSVVQALGSFVLHEPGDWTVPTRWIGDGFDWMRTQLPGCDTFECYSADVDPTQNAVSNWPAIKGSVANYQAELLAWSTAIQAYTPPAVGVGYPS